MDDRAGRCDACGGRLLRASNTDHLRALTVTAVIAVAPCRTRARFAAERVTKKAEV
jgi:hypothetical protein